MGAIAGVAAVIAIILILLERGGGSGSEKYKIIETQDSRFCEVIDTETANTVFVGSFEQCEDWIRSNG